MKIQQFLEHHGIGANPFAEEDAQTDPVFKTYCIANAHHPAWEKVYGDPSEPATSVVFGEKGSGKTALRLQIVKHIEEYNRAHPAGRVFVIEYDDFNPFLDRFRDRVGKRRDASRVLDQWKLWDHMDAILSIGVTKLVDRILGVRNEDESNQEQLNLKALDRHQSRDLLLLAACYDQSTWETFRGRWSRLRRKLRFSTLRAKKFLLLGMLVTLTVVGVVAGTQHWDWLASPWPYLFVILGWLPWAIRAGRLLWTARGIARELRVINHTPNPLRQVLGNFTSDELSNQPLPTRARTDDRYELLSKLQGVLKSLGYGGIVVLVDRVDEPHLINGSPDLMRQLLWSMLDNKFLKHQGIGFKLLLPIELSYYINREDRDFYQRARLDKQNMVPSLEWTGEALYDVANARLRACANNGRAPKVRDLFDESINDRRLIDAFRGLRVPRHLFKFLYRAMAAHCNAHTEDQPAWRITGETFESALALYQRDQDAFDRGMGAG
ncbi:MAG: hypothetical protein K1X71_01635 [Pirellulales bacterium]|nr:hypothetical protein [Pirellulales bacterium]